MKQLRNFFWALIALIVPVFALAQTPSAPAAKIAVDGYTDDKGHPLPGGDSVINFNSDGSTTTLTLTNLYAYGESSEKEGGADAKREAWYGENPAYFRGGTVYALELGNDWCGGKTAASVKLDNKCKDGVIASAKVGDNQVVLRFPTRKANGTSVRYLPMNFLLVKADGKQAWLGHAGWKPNNNAVGIGDFMVLAANDKRFPATVVGYDTSGKVVRLTPQSRRELARIIQPPSGTQPAPQEVAAGKDD